jgi:hypothetical protein
MEGGGVDSVPYCTNVRKREWGEGKVLGTKSRVERERALPNYRTWRKK